MQNESGEVVDTYIPRKCSASGRIIGAKDHASVQIEVDEKTGRMSGGVRHMAISGFIRGMGESDDCLNRLCTEAGILSGVSDQHGMSECMNVYVLVSESVCYEVCTILCCQEYIVYESLSVCCC